MSFFDNVKDVLGIVQKADNIELYQKVLDLQKDALDLIEENKLLKDKIKQLEDNKNIKERLTFKNNCYYLKIEDGTFDGPFCSTCWDNYSKLIRMRNTAQNDSGFYRCNACDSYANI